MHRRGWLAQRGGILDAGSVDNGLMDLAVVLQRLYDSEINVTITTLWDGGFDFALISYLDFAQPKCSSYPARLWQAPETPPAAMMASLCQSSADSICRRLLWCVPRWRDSTGSTNTPRRCR